MHRFQGTSQLCDHFNLEFGQVKSYFNTFDASKEIDDISSCQLLFQLRKTIIFLRQNNHQTVILFLVKLNKYKNEKNKITIILKPYKAVQ